MSELIQVIQDCTKDITNVIIRVAERLASFFTFGLSDKAIKWVQDKYEKNKPVDGGSSWSDDKLSYLPNASATNQMINNYNSNAINNTSNSPSITQNIEIATNQPANDIQQSLKYANALMTA